LSTLTEEVISELQRALPAYRAADRDELHNRIHGVLETAIRAVGREAGDKLGMDVALRALTQRAAGQVSVTELVVAVWLAYCKSLPIAREVAEGDLDRYSSIEDELFARLAPWLFKYVDAFASHSQQRLVRLNESLSRSNDELQELRARLDDQVKKATSQLAEVERVKARVAEIVPSGLMLVDRGTHVIRMFNPALEKITGLSASHVLGRTTDEASHLIGGIPFEEFTEQVRFHGEVGLRKLRLSPPGTSQRTVYVRGMPFVSPQGKHVATLYVIDDVTEREHVLESLSRYLSHDVVERVLSGASPMEPDGESQNAAILSATVRGVFDREPAPTGREIVSCLDHYVRAVAASVLHHGGTIERLTSDGTLVYFPRSGGNAEPALRAAVELARSLAAINRVRNQGGQAPIGFAIGVHLGEILVINVGGKQRMVQTVVGPGAQVADTLQRAAASGEILASGDAIVGLGDEMTFLEEREVVLPGREGPLSARRVHYDLDNLPEPEPVTMRNTRIRDMG